MKDIIRKEIIEKRSRITKEQKEEWSQSICQQILNWDIFQKSKSVMLYSSIRNEVDLSAVVEKLLMDKKTVIFPKSIKLNKRLVPCIIKSISDLKLGSYGIMEPEENFIANKGEIDLILVPGVAFNPQGYRIGYGAGYYDRFLEGFKGITAGIAYSFQITDFNCIHEHDAQLNYIITENAIQKIIKN
ncbi:MAG TPA: 5-formyltetrahydrofolate cyclo-ligase [Clostridiaceae bacterium]|jgi:5-formyltetrahydrofolate cyclo-ligase|nr:5-formyltetrahydrofolate cyclo-ligase [Clostridiaceae bacterium]HBN27612.1 5-formyltetrahydrofolate cyclo-ligase [Clostridiaceae bacterium]HBX48957.1 5-formyltetrahydrofolate cyclo-ligase [Clostridiaceae bacterium]HCL50934.1 5-formyltetrahydrofolate cyclo-ligase [Clostridiaceae bacterium]